MENRGRIIAILNILYQDSDDENFVNATIIADKLKNEYGITCDRKTIYADIKTLQDLGYEIESSTSKPNNGYSIYGSPFNLAEIKIIEDMLNSFKPLDAKNTKDLIDQLYRFISLRNQKFLKHISVDTKKKTNHLLYDLETILKAIRNEETLEIDNKRGLQTIIPYMLHYENNNYYLYYEYVDQEVEKIYHIRLDRLKRVNSTSHKHLQPMKFDKCSKIIAESYDAFNGEETLDIKLETFADYVLEDLSDNFDNVIINGSFATIKTSVSNNLFGKLCAYGDKVRIVSPESFKEAYIAYLKKTISQYD